MVYLTQNYYAFIFHSPHTKENILSRMYNVYGDYSDSGVLYNGQIVIYIGTGGGEAIIKWYDLDDRKWKEGWVGQSGSWDTPTYKNHLRSGINGQQTDGYCINITAMNDVVYGSTWLDPHSGGSVYTTRYRTNLTNHSAPAQRKGIAFSRKQGYIQNNNILSNGAVWIRCFGFYEAGEDWQETTGEYYYEDISLPPSMYQLNTF